jgi:hypothetical protein
MESCSLSKSKQITMIGTALEDKEGAFILVEKKGMYFIDCLYQWDDKFYGKKAKATGKLKIEIKKEKSTFPGELQESVGKKATIKKAKWCLFE